MRNNQLINASNAPRNEKGIWTLLDIFVLLPLIYFALLIPAVYIARKISFMHISNYFLQTLEASGVNLILNFSMMILAVWLVIILTEYKSVLDFGLNGRHRLRRYIFGFYLGFMMMTLVTFFIIFLGGGKVDPSFLRVSGVAALPTMAIMLLGWIVQGAAEEIAFRGFILSKLSFRFNVFWGVLISSILFSLLHISNHGINTISFINLILFGLFAALYSLYEEGLLGICALHAAWNFFQGNVFGFLVSGQAPKGGSLIGIISSNKTLINGGDFGPEGGLVVTFVLTGAIIWFAYLLYKKEKIGGYEEELDLKEKNIFFKNKDVQR